jgi:hypothetical protein
MNEVLIHKLEGDLTDLRKDIFINFKSRNKSCTQFSFQKNLKAYPGKVAVMCQFVPNFVDETMETT